MTRNDMEKYFKKCDLDKERKTKIHWISQKVLEKGFASQHENTLVKLIASNKEKTNLAACRKWVPVQLKKDDIDIDALTLDDKDELDKIASQLASKLEFLATEAANDEWY